MLGESIQSVGKFLCAFALFLFLHGVAWGQTPGDWHAADTAWKGKGSLDWVFRARTGMYRDTSTLVTTRTNYYINDDIPGMMEYLPAGYNSPANSGKTYPLIIYTPGCGETHNGVFYKHLDGSPNYYYGTGRLLFRATLQFQLKDGT
jgi:hypothetical protein